MQASGYQNQTYTVEFDVPGALDGTTFSPPVVVPSANPDPQQIYRPEVEDNLGLITPDYVVTEGADRRGAEGFRWIAQFFLVSPVPGNSGALLDIVDAVDGPAIQQQALDDLSGVSTFSRITRPFMVPQGSLIRISGFDASTTPIRVRTSIQYLADEQILLAQQTLCRCNANPLSLVNVSASRSIQNSDLGTLILVDPGGGTVTLTLDQGQVPGFYAEVIQIGTGTVNFAAGAGALVNSLVGATPALTAQFAGATVTKYSNTEWVVNGSIV